jgi:hypothetical protein
MSGVYACACSWVMGSSTWSTGAAREPRRVRHGRTRSHRSWRRTWQEGHPKTPCVAAIGHVTHEQRLRNRPTEPSPGHRPATRRPARARPGRPGNDRRPFASRATPCRLCLQPPYARCLTAVRRCTGPGFRWWRIGVRVCSWRSAARLRARATWRGSPLASVRCQRRRPGRNRGRAGLHASPCRGRRTPWRRFRRREGRAF